MKKIFFLITLSILINGCCKDDSEESNININIPLGTIVAKIDGIETTFNVEAIADTITIPWLSTGNAFRLDISGKNNISNNSKNIRIWFFATPAKVIDAGTYPDLNKQIYQFINFKNSWNNNLYEYQSNGSINAFYSSNATIVRNDSIVQGIFNGNVIIGAGAPNSVEQPPLYHKIENGMFNVRVRQ